MSSAPVQVPPRKRRKTQLACNPCRARKSACDGARPVCTSCSSKGCQQQCTYQESVSCASSRPTISELQRRLERLEGSPVSHQPTSHALDSTPVSKPHPLGSTSNFTTDTGIRIQHESGRVRPSPNSEEPAPARPSQLSNHSSEVEDESTYGPSSNASFLQQITLLAHPKSSAQQSQCVASAGKCIEGSMPTVLGFSDVQRKGSNPLPGPILLPERRHADILIKTFWELVHNVFPILHKPSFITSYEALWQPTSGRGSSHSREYKHVVFHATPSMVLALGSQRANQTSVGEQAHTADTFYNQSIQLISMDTLDHSSLEVVQLLLLRGVFLHYTPSYLAFFAHSLALFEVLNEVLARFYSGDDFTTERRAEYPKDFLQLSSKLDDLNDSFPGFLRRDGDLGITQLDEELRSCLQMQTNILKSRVLWIRLLLLRPLLLAEVKHGSRSKKSTSRSCSLRDSLSHAAKSSCVATAHDVLQETYEWLGSAQQNSPWHVLLFTFAAASTLVVATLCPDLQVTFDNEPTNTSWDRALRIFDFHKNCVTSASKGIEVLQRFRNLVDGISLHTHSTETHPEHHQDQGDLPLPFSLEPDLDQTFIPEDFEDMLNFDLLHECWFGPEGIDFNNWPTLQ